MITYKIDKTAQTQADSDISDMEDVLNEITPTLRTLYEIITRHELAISYPSMTEFRAQLKQEIGQAIESTRAIAEKSKKLVLVSDQAAKHLVAIEEHFGAALRANNEAPREASAQITRQV